MDRVAAHVEAFNLAVTAGDWATFTTRFAEDATMPFVGVPAGPYEGRLAITQGYRDNPPTEIMTLLTTNSDEARFRWSGGGTGAMHLSWTSDGRVSALTVTFDDSPQSLEDR